MVRKNLRRLFTVILSVFPPFLGTAEPQSSSFSEVLTRALVDSPLVKEVAARDAERRLLGYETRTMANPTLDSELRIPESYRNERGDNEVAIALSQPLRPSDFGSRGRVADLMQRTASMEEKLALLGFSQKLKLSFAKSWALAQRVSEVKRSLERVSSIEQQVAQAAESGFVPPGEKALFKAEAVKARYQLDALLSDLQRARAELSKVAGFEVPGALLRPELGALPSSEELLGNGERLPARERASLAVKLATEQLRLAELDAYPKFAPRLVYERTNDSSEYVGVGVSIELPFFHRNQGAKSVRSAELSAAHQVNRYFSGEGFEAEVRALRSSIESSTALLTGYEREILPALREAVVGEEKLLASGQGSFFRVWQTLRELSNAEAEVVERVVGVFSNRSELALLLGVDL
jgi:outer membrane protein TolC